MALHNPLATPNFSLLWKLFFLSCVSRTTVRQRQIQRVNFKKYIFKDLNKSVFTCSDPIVIQYSGFKHRTRPRFKWGKWSCLRLDVHTEAKCLLQLPVWLESLKRNDYDSGKLYNINHNLRRGSYKARHIERSGRTPVRRNAGWDTDVRENIQQFCNLYSWWNLT